MTIYIYLYFMILKKNDQSYLRLVKEYRNFAINNHQQTKVENYHENLDLKQLLSRRGHRKPKSEHMIPKIRVEYLYTKNTSPRFRLKHLTINNSTTAKTSRLNSPKHNSSPAFPLTPRLYTQQRNSPTSQLTAICSFNETPLKKTEPLPSKQPQHPQTHVPRILTNFISTPHLDIEIKDTKRSKKELRSILMRALTKLKAMNIDPATMIEKRVFSKKPYQRQLSQEFIHAVKLNQLQKVQEMLEHNQYLVFDFDYFNMTGLHWACKKGNFEMAELLIKHHCDVDAVDVLHRTPLFLAIEGGFNDISELLLRSKAYPWSTKLTDLGSVVQENLKVKRMLTQVRRIDIVNLWAEKKIMDDGI